MRALITTLCLILPGFLTAGVWDRDRPDDEGLESIIGVITGRFDRPPPAFYELRAERLRPVLASLPDSPKADELSLVVEALPLFDDAAMARMRLGDFGKALILLDRKALHTERLKPDFLAVARRHELRTLANKAACLVARYRADADAADTRDLREAKALLERSLDLDPFDIDARYSLREVDWLLNTPEFDEDELLPNLLGLTWFSMPETRDHGALAALGHAGVIHYLARRIVHEDGWHDLDIMYALSLALWVAGNDEEAVTAWLRVAELVESGAKTSIRGDLRPPMLVRRTGAHLGQVEDLELHRRLYREIREKDEEWHERRRAYMQERLGQGLHPDTDAAFWDDFDQPPPTQFNLEIASPPPEEPVLSRLLVLGGLIALAIVMLSLGGITLILGRRTPKAPGVNEL